MPPLVRGVRTLPSAPMSSKLLSSQNSSISLGRITGIRSGVGLSRSLAVVAMMAYDGMRSQSVSLHSDQGPTKTKVSPVRTTMRMGPLVTTVLCHS